MRDSAVALTVFYVWTGLLATTVCRSLLLAGEVMDFGQPPAGRVEVPTGAIARSARRAAWDRAQAARSRAARRQRYAPTPGRGTTRAGARSGRARRADARYDGPRRESPRCLGRARAAGSAVHGEHGRATLACRRRGSPLPRGVFRVAALHGPRSHERPPGSVRARGPRSGGGPASVVRLDLLRAMARELTP